VDALFLRDGGQPAETVASKLAAFLDGARETLDVAIYDCHLSGPAGAIVVDAFARARARGVAIRLVYNEGHERPIAVPPPPLGNPEFVQTLCPAARAVSGVPDLMHQKYVVRDGISVWSGSTNWTDDSWTREENVVVTLDSAQIAGAFLADFEDLWSSGQVQDSGRPRSGVGATTGAVRAWFSPGQGSQLAHRIATAIGRAERRVRVCSPVLTNGAILGTLADVAARRRVDVAGVVDATQVEEVLRQWAVDKHAGWKTPALVALFAAAPFSGKHSTPYAPGALHDYMHAKFVVADNIVFVGSYNLSGSGEDNAENVLEVYDAGVAGQFTGFVEDLRHRYPSLQLGTAS
jgi:phosphatidylserine/phosphatidylglycerophosphate/cardiolipin synthase-like enzyme